MEFLNSIFNFFTDKTKKFTHKTLLVFASIFGLIFIDNILGFTFFYNNEKKLEQIELTNKILTDSTLNNNEKQKLIKLRTNLIEHTNIKEISWSYLSKIEFKNDEKLTKTSSKKVEEKIKTQNQIQERNYFWHFVSSGWFFLIIMVLLPIVGITNSKDSATVNFITTIVVIPIFLGISWVFAKIFSFIPIIYSNPINNYLLNGFLCLGIVLISGFLINKNEKNKKNYG